MHPIPPQRPFVLRHSPLWILISASFFLLACGPKDPAKPTPGSISTERYPDYTAALPKTHLTAFAAALGNATNQAEVARKVNAYAGGFRTLVDIERAYWTLLTYKYLRQVSEPSNFSATFRTLEERGAPFQLSLALHQALENLGNTDLPNAFGMLGGLHQFGMDGTSEERNEEIRDRLYWRSEVRSIQALLKTNTINHFFLPGMESNRQAVYELPVTNIGSLYIYEHGGTPWSVFKAVRLEHLNRLKLSFAPADRWIFTNTHWPDVEFHRRVL